MSKQVLGRGLSALIPGAETTRSTEAHYAHIDVSRIAPNPMQPRRVFGQERLEELTESIKANGVVQPLVVKRDGQSFTIIAGERRFRAAKLAGLDQVPVIIWDDVNDVRMLELALVENIHREDLNPLELAQAYQHLIEQCRLTQVDLAKRVGRSRAAVANHLRLLNLPDSIKRLISENRLSEGHARAMLTLPSEAQMLQMAERIISNSISVREVEAATGRKKKRRLIPKRKSAEVDEIENRLKRMLGTSVRIVTGLKRGRIEIEYYGNDDLERIWQMLSKLESAT